jgi:hypothetical protein
MIPRTAGSIQKESSMANEKSFAAELNELITRYINARDVLAGRRP